MAVEVFSGTEAIGAVEHSFTRDAGSPSPDVETSDGDFLLVLDLSDMVGGDEFRIRIYEKVRSGGTQRVMHEWNLTGPQPPIWVMQHPLPLIHGWDMTGYAATGTITVEWSIRAMGGDTSAFASDVAAIKAKTDSLTFTVANKVDANTTHIAGTAVTAAAGIPEVKVASIAANAITATAIAADAITAAKVADGTIDAATFAAGAINAAAIASDAITDAKVASDVTIASVTGAVGSVTGAVGSVTGNVGGNVTGSVGSVAAGGIVAASFAADSITAAKLAADVTTELQAGLATQASVDDLPTNAELATALGTADDAVLAQVALVKAKTDNLPSDPADQSLVIAATDALVTLIGDVPTNAELATALGTADDAVLAQVALVKTKTDSLTFTVAGKVDANITHVNDVEVIGDGETGTEWGPAP